MKVYLRQPINLLLPMNRIRPRTDSSVLQLCFRAAKLRRELGVGKVLLLFPLWCVTKASAWRDSRFDRRYGTNTSGSIQLRELHVEGPNREAGIWYEPMSCFMFRQILGRMQLGFERFTFIDFGSGKGRCLLLASDYPFKTVIGVEFAPQLHRLAQQNINKYCSKTNASQRVTSVCLDATEYALPIEPALCFFFSPFKSLVLAKVLNNIVESVRAFPRDFVLVFHGSNSESIDLFRRTGWDYEEWHLKRDWSKQIKYRTVVCRSHCVGSASKH